MQGERIITLEYLEKYFIQKPIFEFPNKAYKNAENIKVTVFMCTYNHEEFISQSLDGILNQNTNFEFEIIISEDESSDNTRQICIEYAKNHPDCIRLFLHNRENNLKILGKPSGILPHVFNLIHSKGKYIAVCAGDDSWTDENKLQTQFDYLESNIDCSMVYQRWQDKILNKDGTFHLGEPRKDFPKASTSMFLNFNDRIPVQMLNVIQEDAFRWFILKSNGRFKCIENLKPVIVNTPNESITRSLSEFEFFKHNLNLKRNIFKAYQGTDRDTESKLQYISILYSAIDDKKYKSLRLKCFYYAFISIIKDKLFNFTMKRFLFELKSKLQY